MSRLPKKRREALLRLINRYIFLASKREKLIFSSCMVTALTLFGSIAVFPYWLGLFVLSSMVCLGLVLFSLAGELKGKRYFFIPLFPLVFMQAVQLALLVIPLYPVLKIGVVIAFGIVFYLVLLIANIFNISAIRTIPLIRAAHAASFFLVLVTVFLLLFFLITLKMHPLALMVSGSLLIFLPTVYFFWTFELKDVVTQAIITQAIVVTIIIGQLTMILSMWPVSPLVFALFLSTIYYICTGLLHQEFVRRLQKKIIAEYLLVFFFAIFLLFFMSQWAG